MFCINKKIIFTKYVHFFVGQTAEQVGGRERTGSANLAGRWMRDMHQCARHNADLALWPSRRLPSLLCEDHTKCRGTAFAAAALRDLSSACKSADLIVGQLAHTGIGQQLFHGCQELGLGGRACGRRRRLCQLLFDERCAQRASRVPSAHAAHGGWGTTPSSSVWSAAWRSWTCLAIG